MPTTAESLQAEAARIEQAYARRKRGYLYSRFNPAYLFMVQEREQRFLALLAPPEESGRQRRQAAGNLRAVS